MAKRRKLIQTPVQSATPTHQAPANGWVTTEAFVLGSKTLKPGDLVSIHGERGGRFKFLSHVVRPDGAEWLNVLGGSTGVKMFRAFRPERLSRVLRTAG